MLTLYVGSMGNVESSPQMSNSSQISEPQIQATNREWFGAWFSLLSAGIAGVLGLMTDSRMVMTWGMIALGIAYYLGRLRTSQGCRTLGFLFPGAIVLVYFMQTLFLGQFTYHFLAETGLTHPRSFAAELLATRCYLCGFAAYVCGESLFALLAVKSIGEGGGVVNYKDRVIGARGEALIILVYLAGLSGILLFYSLRGIPILQGNVEGGRIEAVKGMNYVYALALQLTNAAILMAFLQIPKLKELRWGLICLAMLLLLTLGYRAPVALFLFALLAKYSLQVRTVPIFVGFIVTQALLSVGILVGFLRSLASGAMDANVAINWMINGFVEYRELAYSLDVVKEGTLGGATYLAGILLFIPSGIFPGKPDGLGLFLKSALYTETYQGGGIRVGMIGESVLNFGIVGVLAVMFAYGVISGWFSRFLLEIRFGYGKGVAFLLYAYLGYSGLSTLLGGDFAGFIFGFFRDGFLILFTAFSCIKYSRAERSDGLIERIK